MQRTWNYTQGGESVEIVFDTNQGILLITDEQTVSFSFSDWLSQYRSDVPLDIDRAILKEIIANEPISSFDVPVQKHYQFWKVFDGQGLDNKVFKPLGLAGNWGQRELYLDAIGYCKEIAKETQGKRVARITRLSNLLFEGAKFALSLKDRKELRILLLKTVEGVCTKQDAFPLFHYDKIPQKRYENIFDKGSKGEFLELKEGCIKVGGWEHGGRFGGSYFLSIESAWANPRQLIGDFEEARAEIRGYLEAAIEENS